MTLVEASWEEHSLPLCKQVCSNAPGLNVAMSYALEAVTQLADAATYNPPVARTVFVCLQQHEA